MKSLFTVLLSIIMIPLSAQINVRAGFTDSHILISPEGISSKYTDPGGYNVALGAFSLRHITTGSRNISIGQNALFYNKAQSCNIAIGTSSMLRFNGNISGTETYNTAIGFESLVGGLDPLLNTGTFNTAIGARALGDNTSGIQNVAVGTFAGSRNTTGLGNVFIGYGSGGSVNVNNKLFIANSGTDAPLIKGDFSTNELKINSKLKIGGTGDTPQATLQVAGNYAISGKITLDNSSPTISHNLNLDGKSVIIIQGSTPLTITGIAGGVDGIIVHIAVASASTLTIANNSFSSLDGNRIVTGDNADLTISNGGGGATLIYDSSVHYWRVIGLKQ